MTAPADLSQLPPLDMSVGADPGLLRDELLHLIGEAIVGTPRSRQTRIGPSGLGTPCTRKLAHRIAETSPATRRPAPWKPAIGSAVHAWLADVFTEANRSLDVARWLVEMKVRTGQIGEQDIDGSCDLYDRVTATVIDYKITTRNKIKQYRADGPGPEYEVQADCYGCGWEARGLPVATVAVMFLPRDGELADTHLWHKPHDCTNTRDAFDRANQVKVLLDQLGPQALALMPTAPDYCTHCAWYVPGATDLTRACPGDPNRDHYPDPLQQLVNGSTHQEGPRP
jgi:hypothetical protein